MSKKEVVFLICCYSEWGWEIPQNGYEVVREDEKIVIYAIDKNFNGPPEVTPHKIIINMNHDNGRWDFVRQKTNINIVKKTTETIINLKNYPEKYGWTDPLIIIFTLEIKDKENIRGYPEWIKAKSIGLSFYDDGLKECDKGKSRGVEFETGDYTVLFVKENNLKKEGIDGLLNKILSHNKWGNIPEKYVAVHDLRSYIKDVSQFKDKVKYICDFHHYRTGVDAEFCKVIKDFLDDIERNNNSEAVKKCEEIIKLIKKLSHIFAFITNQIAHLFLPLDIDLQGISEVLKSNGEDQAKRYYDQAFRNSGGQRLENKIKEAKDLIKEFPRDKKRKIFKFLDNNGQLKKVKKALQNWDETKELLQEENPFHSWFCSLMKCLENLREK